MDEMNNMNEVTTEETSNEVTPVVAENNEAQEEPKNFGVKLPTKGLVVAGVVAGAVLLIKNRYDAHKKHKAEKEENAEGKGKVWGIELRSPIVIKKKDKQEVKDVEYKDVVENTTEEEN